MLNPKPPVFRDRNLVSSFLYTVYVVQKHQSRLEQGLKNSMAKLAAASVQCTTWVSTYGLWNDNTPPPYSDHVWLYFLLNIKGSGGGRGGVVGRGGESARSYKTFLARHFLWLCCCIYTLARRILNFYSVLGILHAERMPSCRRWRLVVCKGGRSVNKFRISLIRKFFIFADLPQMWQMWICDLRTQSFVWFAILKLPQVRKYIFFCFYKYMKHIKNCFQTYLSSFLWKFADLWFANQACKFADLRFEHWLN